MERPLPPLDEILQMARDNDWDRRIWKPAYWHELGKNKSAKPRAYGQVVQWAGLTLFWPTLSVLLALMPGDGRIFVTMYVLLGMIHVRSSLNKFWEAWGTLQKVRADQVKLGEISDRYYEDHGEMLDPSEGNHRRV